MGDEVTREAILEAVAQMIGEVVGADWAQEVHITARTSFQDDLELESIEFVALAERMEARYGRQVDFSGWLGGMELDQIIALRVGDVVDHVLGCLRQAAGP